MLVHGSFLFRSRSSLPHIRQHGAGGGNGIGGFEDRAADDEEASAIFHGRGRSRHALLISHRIAWQADAGCDEQRLRAEFLPHRADFLRGANQPIYAAADGEFAERQHLLRRRTRDAEIVQVALIEARQHGDGDKFWRGRAMLRGRRRRAV